MSDSSAAPAASLLHTPETSNSTSRKRPKDDLSPTANTLETAAKAGPGPRKKKRSGSSSRTAPVPQPRTLSRANCPARTSPEYLCAPMPSLASPVLLPESAARLLDIQAPSQAKTSSVTLSATAEEEFEQFLDQLEVLKQQVNVLSDQRAAEQGQLAQRMMLDMEFLKRDHARDMEKLMRQKCYAKARADDQSAESERQMKRAEEEKAKHVKAIVELNFYKDEVDHLQSLNKTMEDDLDELRQIENEDRSQRRLESKEDLPPAYGSLHDHERFPTPYLHRDSGYLDVAAFKRTVRRDFMAKLQQAQDKRSSEMSSGERWEMDAVIFMDMSSALADAARTLRAAFEYSKPMLSAGTSQESRPDSQTNEIQASSSKPKTPRSDFVADRIAKTILDLSWRLAAAIELRPSNISVSRNQKANLSLAYKEIDDCFIDALRNAFTLNSTGNTRASVLLQYQYFSTQLSALRRALIGAVPSGVSSCLFTKSNEWLRERVESERMELANEEGQDSGTDDSREDIIAGSEISSNAETGTESSSNTGTGSDSDDDDSEESCFM